MATVKMTDDHFLCPVCLDFFKEPVMLECGHNFCKSCIDKTWDSQEIILCPECREEFPTKKYTINRLLRNLVETAERAQQCEEAGKPHQEQQTGCVVQSHECLEHKELLKVFCQEDGSPICLVCTMSSKHAGHKFQPLQEAVSMFQEKLKTAEAALKLRMNDLNKYQIQQQQLISGVKHEAQSFEQHIKSEFSMLHQFLQDKEQQLIQKLKDETTTITGEMKENLRKIEEKNETIQRQISAIQSKLQQEDPLHFLTGIKDEIESVMKEEEKEGNANVILVSENLSPGVYKGPLQYSVWKEMLSVINPGLSPVTFDSNTADRKFLLSLDLTNVEYCCFRDIIPVNSDGSDLCFVMGSEGFTSGRHYWEVEVEVALEHSYLMTWTVGVTKKCSHGELLHIKNPGDGYWVLTLRNPNAYLSLDLTKKFFRHDVKPQKVGVYLDYEEGQVSFYDAENMSHLYTFTDTFTERLYPFFHLHAEFSELATTSLMLFHLKV